MTGVVGVVPEAAVAMTIVSPAGVVDDRVETQSFEWNAGSRNSTRLLTDVTQPRRTRVAFDAGLRDEDRPAIAFVNFGQHLADRTVQRMRRRKQYVRTSPRSRRVWILVNPLVV